MMKRKYENALLNRLFHSAIPVRIRRIGASRAVFETDEVQRIDLTLELDYGQKIKLEMNPQLAHKLIRELTTAYLAINPPIRNYGGGVPFDGGM